MYDIVTYSLINIIGIDTVTTL